MQQKTFCVACPHPSLSIGLQNGAFAPSVPAPVCGVATLSPPERGPGGWRAAKRGAARAAPRPPGPQRWAPPPRPQPRALPCPRPRALACRVPRLRGGSMGAPARRVWWGHAGAAVGPDRGAASARPPVALSAFSPAHPPPRARARQRALIGGRGRECRRGWEGPEPPAARKSRRPTKNKHAHPAPPPPPIPLLPPPLPPAVPQDDHHQAQAGPRRQAEPPHPALVPVQDRHQDPLQRQAAALAPHQAGLLIGQEEERACVCFSILCETMGV